MNLQKKSKKRFVCAIIVIMATFVSMLNVYAGSYTSSDPYKNYSFNRTAAKNYINQYYGFQAPYEGSGSGTASGTYYNFYNDDGDCTNFVSQVLKAGGMSYSGTNRNYYSSWFYNGTYPYYSCTWTSAHWARKYWGNVNNVGMNKVYRYKVYSVSNALANWSSIWYYMWDGDFVQHADIHGNTVHTQVIHGYSSGYMLYYAQHSTLSYAFYRYGDTRGQLVGKPSNEYFFTYQIKNGS